MWQFCFQFFKKPLGFPHSSVSNESACNAEDWGLIPGSRRSHGEGNGNLLQYSCLQQPRDRGAWQITVHGVARVRHKLAFKPPPYCYPWWLYLFTFQPVVREVYFCFIPFPVFIVYRFLNFIFNWRLIALQFCVGLYETST